MALVYKIATTQPDAASNTSLTSAFQVPGELSHYFIEIPTIASFCITATCSIKILGSETEDGTYRVVGYQDTPFAEGNDWATAVDQENRFVICEALQYVPGWAKLQFSNTATASVDFKIFARKFN